MYKILFNLFIFNYRIILYTINYKLNITIEDINQE
jgi:hypothetical protein